MIDIQPDDISGGTASNASGSIAAQPLSIGAALREARVRLGLEVADVANRIKFAPRQIEALEQDNFADLPEMAFVRGFVRSYARLLQLDSAPLLAALPGVAVQPAAPSGANMLAEAPFPNIYSVRKPNIIWLAAALGVAVVLVLFTWLHGNAVNPPKAPQVETLALSAALPVSAVPDVEVIKAPKVAAPKVQPVVAPPAKQVVVSAATSAKPFVVPAVKPAATNRASGQNAPLRLVFDEESWVEVTDRDGKVLLSQLGPRGSEQSINGKPPFSIVIGRASGVHLYYKEQAVNLKPHTKAEVAHLTLE